MNRSIFSSKRVAAVALGLAALAAAGAAQAKTDVFFSIGLPGPVYSQPAPVYYPQPVYSQPAPVYVPQQPVYVQPRPVYEQPQPVYVQPQPVYGYGYGRWENRRHWEHGGRGPWGDADRDGVPNRYDRFPGQHNRH